MQLGVRIPAATMRRAWTMLRHYHGQLFSGAELARSLDVAQTTARRYASMRSPMLVVRQLTPWFANIEATTPIARSTSRTPVLLHRLLGIDRLSLERNRSSARAGRSCSSSLRPYSPNPLYCGRAARRRTRSLCRIIWPSLWIRDQADVYVDFPVPMRSALVDLQLARLAIVYLANTAFP